MARHGNSHASVDSLLLGSVVEGYGSFSARLNPESSKHTYQTSPPTATNTSQKKPRSRKQPREADHLPLNTTAPHPKQPRASPATSTAIRRADLETLSGSIEAPINPIDYWRREQRWPKEYFKPDIISYLFARIRYIEENKEGIIEESRNLCRTLLETEQIVPKNSLFKDKLFQDTCKMLQDRNKAKVTQDISYAKYSAKHLQYLIKTIYYIYFLFLTCKNIHSIILIVRAIIKLFRLVKREKEIYWEILAFSVLYNNYLVQIYGHYTVISRAKTTFYCHLIREFSFQEIDRKEK
ncbi:uncharacterized protein BDZ99DRAFT_491227 [Mytilinidion resinicola]|uniref:DUF7924 domain-containing protein n=1 Tax=Mytilinidion resinicola TaxID=574789 RepID=A0A6A6Y6K9_9PEZI|nr:uncharacterized protein BDZ99DRAFT_491227 [Mytilinidion resinicola]KAF2804461.1 hypothetical protein BDZ99DRAFT_491227 [Mytilinidion resinicola]